MVRAVWAQGANHGGVLAGPVAARVGGGGGVPAGVGGAAGLGRRGGGGGKRGGGGEADYGVGGGDRGEGGEGGALLVGAPPQPFGAAVEPVDEGGELVGVVESACV